MKSSRRRGATRRLYGDIEDRAASAWEAVYAIVRAIPRSQVMTYGQISMLLGGRLSPAAVGWALHVCPEDVPWHRVVNASGRCSTERLPDMPIGMQQALLTGEGVDFSLAGALDLGRVRFEPAASTAPGREPEVLAEVPPHTPGRADRGQRRVAKALLDLDLAIDTQTDLMVLDPDERAMSPAARTAELALARRS